MTVLCSVNIAQKAKYALWLFKNDFHFMCSLMATQLDYTWNRLALEGWGVCLNAVV